MEFLASGILSPFEVTFGDPSLFVRAAIYDMSSGTPVFISNAVMSEVTTGTYVGTFTPANNTTYLIVKRVFTDGTYATVDTNYSPSSESAQSKTLSSSSSSGGSNCGLVVTLESSELVVSLEEGQLVVSLESSLLDASLNSDSLTVQFNCGT